MANGSIPYSADMEFFAFEIEIVNMKDGAQLSFGVQDRSCEMNKLIGTEDFSLGTILQKNNSLLNFEEKSKIIKRRSPQ